ncbi:MAG TPA: hypothetical protein VGL81_10410 [Polyangiaceae bacterium]
MTCIVETRDQAEMVLDQLSKAGFSNNDISVLLPDKTGKVRGGNLLVSVNADSSEQRARVEAIFKSARAMCSVSEAGIPEASSSQRSL